jgi:hypothetical protein
MESESGSHAHFLSRIRLRGSAATARQGGREEKMSWDDAIGVRDDGRGAMTRKKDGLCHGFPILPDLLRFEAVIQHDDVGGVSR